MSFDGVQFCKDYKLPYDTSGANTAPGWIQIACPFCGDNTNHFGIHLKNAYGNCWKCGWHPLDGTISELLGVSNFDAKKIVDIYSNKKMLVEAKKERIIPNLINLPRGTEPLTPAHKKYLKSRKFDPVVLQSLYQLEGTVHIGDSPFRIIAPIYLDGNLVSYQGRDYTGRSEIRYKACNKELEIVHHKDTLYGIDLAVSLGKGMCLVVEGITDVWRLGPGAVSTFGTSWKRTQMLMLAERFDTIYILFDEGIEAQQKAESLAWELSVLGKDVSILQGIEGDPGEMEQEEADELMRELFN